LLAIQLEERDIIGIHGGAYESYRKRVPMIVPLSKVRAADRTDPA
jgi:protein-S-isoprenylcysteine O-methyltransferase Ste14